MKILFRCDSSVAIKFMLGFKTADDCSDLYHCHSQLTSQMNLFILFQVFAFYTVKVNTDFENIKKNMNIFEVSIHFYFIKCEYLAPNDWIHLQSQLAMMTVFITVPYSCMITSFFYLF